MLNFWGITGPKSAQCTLKWAAAVSRGIPRICRGEPRNLANGAAEFGKICRGKLWALVIVDTSNLVLWIEHSKSEPTDDKLSLKWAWSRHVTHFNFLVPLRYLWNCLKTLNLVCMLKVGFFYSATYSSIAATSRAVQS